MALIDSTNAGSDDKMPEIENAQETLQDIYNQTAKTPVMKWIYRNAELPTPE